MFWFNLQKVFQKNKIDKAYAKCKRNSKKGMDTTAVVFFDLDKMKNINDEHSHLMGDKVITHYLEILEKFTRSEDSLVRFGGDEVLIFIPNIQKEALETRIKQIQKSCLESSYYLHLIGKGMSVTVGALLLDDPFVYSLDELIDKTSRLTKRAKFKIEHYIIKKIENMSDSETLDIGKARRSDSDGILMRNYYDFIVSNLSRTSKMDAALINSICKELWREQGDKILTKWGILQINEYVEGRYEVLSFKGKSSC